MCWSWQVSLSFVLFQVFCLGYTFYRNKYIDRWYCLICLPFVGQEFCQFIEWAFGDIESVGDNYSQCNDINKVFAKIIIVVAFTIPLVIAFFAYKTSVNVNNSKYLRIMWKYWFYFELITFFIIVPMMMIDDECVNVGPNGHQHWPPLFTASIFTKYLGEIPTAIITSVYYFPSIFLVAVFYRPLWVTVLPAVYGAVSLGAAIMIIGDESWSVWCWSCAWFALWTVIYVPIANVVIKQWREKKFYNKKKDFVTDDILGDNICSKIFLKNSHQQLAKFNMLTEHETTEAKEISMGASYASVAQSDDQQDYL
eukprot:246606_1